jgi:hypothetical protein
MSCYKLFSFCSIDHSTNQDPEIMSKRKLECTENELEMAEKKFKRSCEQIVLLNDKLDDLQTRYDTAKRDDRRSFRYPLRLKIAVVDGG